MSHSKLQRVVVTIVILAMLITGMFANSFVRADNSGPEWLNQGQSRDSITQGETNALYAQGRDSTGLDWAWLATNETGQWKNYTSVITQTAWWNNAWTKRARLDLNNLGQPENLIDFPMLVVLNPSRISYGDFKSDGSDIRFVDPDGTELKYHIEKWDPSGNSFVWVKVPQIDANSASDYVWLYYSNPAAPNVQDSSGTYDSGYVGVWHLSEASGPVKDSTSNANGGTVNDATYTSTAKIDGGYIFDGTDDYINVSTASNLNLVGTSFTLEAWAKFNTVNNARLISKNQESPISNAYQLITDQATLKWGLQVKEAGTDKLVDLSSASVSAGTWYYVVAVINKTGTDYSGSKLYVNGAPVSMSFSAGAIGAAGTSTDLQMGRRADSNPTTFLNGMEDEVRISSTIRSQSWVKASYLTGTDNFITYGSPESYVENNAPEFYGSPIKLNGISNTWVWTNFTWNNASVLTSSIVAWRIYYNNTAGQVNMTDTMTFDILASLDALVLVNSVSPNYGDFTSRIYPYLKHFGIPYETLDISGAPVTSDIESFPLIIIGHANLDPTHIYLDSTEQNTIANAVNNGTGLVNFDYNLQSGGSPIYSYVQTIFGFTYGLDYSTSGPITILTNQSYVTSLQDSGSTYSLYGSMTGANIVGQPSGVTTLANVGSYPFVLVTNYGQGKAVQFSSYQLLDWNILGYFQGIDDIFWRSFVWAARKPFVMRGIPPFVTMRLDDCNGPYTPYMEELNGFKIMLSVFLATGDIESLKSYALSGEALVSVHEATYAGPGASPSYPVASPADAVNFWSSYDSVFTDNGIPMAHSWHAHVAETSSYLIPGMEARGIDLFCTDCDFDTALGNVGTNRWAPYMVDQHSSSSRNAYIFEDWSKVDPAIFNYYSNAWAYGSALDSVFIDHHIGDVQGAINEGVMRVERAFDSMTWGLLMTHEFAIESFGYSNFGTVTSTIKNRLAADGYDPIITDIDTIGYYVRAVATSSIAGTYFDSSSQNVTVTFGGKADVPTMFYLFYNLGGNIESRLVDVPSFTSSTTVTTGFLPQPKPPQNPVLILTSGASTSYGDYVGEMLKTEGLNEYQAEDISLVNNSYLSAFATVVLTSMGLTPARVAMITQYVQDGGTLVAFKPDPALAAQFGLTYTGQYYNNGYLKIDNTTTFGSGITGDAIQYKGTADLYNLNGAATLASLSDNVTTFPNPAVAYYQSNGTAVIFTYNLPWSIALQRQGNPDWARQDRDLASGIRPNDMFYNISGDPQWTDWSKIPIPQADEQQRFLANIILQASSLPLPRLWYFPDDKKTMLIMTGDQDGASSSSIETELADVESYGGHWTSYLWPAQFGSDPNLATEQDWIARGHETAVHYTQTSGTSYADMNSGYNTQTAQFVNAYGHSPLTVRNHAVTWLGWADSAEIEANHGIHMDLNYYHSVYAFGMTEGYFTGSGMPQKFMKQDGTVIDCYQVLTELADEVQLSQQGLSVDQATQVAINMFSGSENGYYSAFAANFHPGGYSGNNRQWANNIMSYAETHGIPIWSAEMLYDFWDARSQASFMNLNYGSNQLAFTLSIPTEANNLTAMIPSQYKGDLIAVMVNGSQHAYTLGTVKGIEYAFVTLNSPGSYNFVVNYGLDVTPPVISGVTAQSITSSSATIVWNTDERADSRVKYGPTDLSSQTYNSQMVMPHAITLTGLTPSTNYIFKVNSTDQSGNTAESAQYQFRTTAAPPLSLVQTTYEDFMAGSLANTYVSNDSDGEVMLTPTLSDLFAGPSLNTTLWNATRGQFTPGLIPYSPTITDGILEIDNLPNEAGGGARMTSQSWFSPPVTIEGRIKFTSTTGSEHFGFYDWAADHDWHICISALGAQISSSVALPGYLQSSVSLGASIGDFHTLKIEYTATTIKFYVDGILRDTRTGTFSNAFPVMVGVFPPGPVYADWVRVDYFPTTSGDFQSSVLDAGTNINWNKISWDSDTPTGTQLEFRTRSSLDSLTWSEWSSPITLNNSQINSPSARYIQYSVHLTSDNPLSSPALRYLQITASFIPTLSLSPTSRICREFGETFTVQVNMSSPVDVQGFMFEIHYNTTLLDYASTSWNAWGTGTVTVDEVNGNITGFTSGNALSGTQTLVTLQFSAAYHHIWKDETTVPGWTNDQSGAIYVQRTNLSYTGDPDLSYVRGGGQNQINVGQDATYTFSPIRGDVDNSGSVDITDLRTVAAYYDQQNTTYNLVGNNTIDLYDLVVIGANFGYTYTP